MTEASTSPNPAPALRCIAWCPDDCDESAAREYVGSTPREIAEQHAEHVYYEQGTRRECYEVRVRATKGDRVREWDVTVDVEVEVSFSATLAFPRKVSKEPAVPVHEVSPELRAEIIDEQVRRLVDVLGGDALPAPPVASPGDAVSPDQLAEILALGRENEGN